MSSPTLSEAAKRAAIVLSALVLSGRLNTAFEYHWVVDRRGTPNITMSDGEHEELEYDITDLFVPNVMDELGHAGLILLTSSSVRSGAEVVALPTLHRAVTAKFDEQSMASARTTAANVTVDGVTIYALANDDEKLAAALDANLMARLAVYGASIKELQQARNAVAVLRMASGGYERRDAAQALLCTVAQTIDIYALNQLLAFLARLPKQPEQFKTSTAEMAAVRA